MRLILRFLINIIAVALSSYILPGVYLSGLGSTILVVIVLGLINLFVKPIVVLLTLPVTIVTLGLFYFVINALLVWLVSVIVPGFRIRGFWWALLFSLVFSIIKLILDKVFGA